MRIYIPFTIMITFNMIVLSKLTKSKKSLLHSGSRATNSIRRREKISNKEYRFKIAMIAIDFTFLLFFTPRAVTLTLGIIDLLTGSISADPLKNVIINTLLLNITQLLAFAYSAVMIFISLIFNRIYRRELLRMFCLHRVLTTLSETNNTSTKPVTNY